MVRWMRLVWIVVGVLCSSGAVSCVWAQGVGMVTGSPTGTYFRFGQDIANVTQQAGLTILVKESEGSIDNIRRLTSSENAALGIVQSDVLGFLSRSADPQVHQIAAKLRLIFPFYNEEVHLFARKDIQRFADLAGKRVVVGTEGSGNWLTANNLLYLLAVQPATLITNLAPPEAVHAVLTDQADAMFYVAGRPVKLFTNVGQLQNDPRYASLLQDVHFVPLTEKKILQEYIPSTMGPTDYPWMPVAIPTVAVKAVLISFDFSSRHNAYYRQRCEQLAHLGSAVRTHLADLQNTGHPKWQEVDLEQRLSIWTPDRCSQVGRPEGRPNEALQKSLSDILKGKR